ncbi:MAG TPA: hypothetical protein ENJ13_03355, partial [Chromatiales bacterium]|nr:hypothetical protein [Chromatiales bacterium]
MTYVIIRLPAKYLLVLHMLAALIVFMGSGTVAAGPIQDLQPGQWYEIPNSKLRDVLPSPVPEGNPEFIIGAWSGGAYDTKRNRLVVWGGGHNNYAGNELYAFDVAQGKWLRLTEPSSSPVSVHTYDQLQYLPVQDRFFAAGGSVWPSGNATRGTWLFDFDTNRWQRRQDIVGGLYDVTEFSMTSVYDPVSEKVLMVGYSASADYDANANTWRHHNNSLPARDLGHTAAFDPQRRKFVSIGRGTAYIYTADSTGKLGGRSPLGASGAREIEDADAPGLVYDPVSDQMVAWGSGSDVYTLDLDTRVWTRHAASNSVNPGDPYSYSYRGTFGRFRYMPDFNAFIVVTGINSNVFVYKLTDGGGSAASPSINFTASVSTVVEGTPAALTWSSADAVSCTASGAWSGAKSTSGSETTAALT